MVGFYFLCICLYNEKDKKSAVVLPDFLHDSNQIREVYFLGKPGIGSSGRNDYFSDAVAHLHCQL